MKKRAISLFLAVIMLIGIMPMAMAAEDAITSTKTAGVSSIWIDNKNPEVGETVEVSISRLTRYFITGVTAVDENGDTVKLTRLTRTRYSFVYEGVPVKINATAEKFEGLFVEEAFHGTITVSKNAETKRATLTVMADEGYEVRNLCVDRIESDGKSYTVKLFGGTDGVYDFRYGSDKTNIYISADFVEYVEPTVKAAETTNGTVSIGNSRAEAGEKVTIYSYPNDGYKTKK